MNLVLLAIAVVAAAVWGTLLVLRGSLIAGCLAFLFCVCCCGHDFVSFDIGPVPLTIDRVALLAVASAYMIQRRCGQADPKPIAPLDWLLGSFIAVLALSMLAHGWQAARPNEVSPLWRLVGGYLIPLVVYWIARQAPVTESQIRLLKKAFVAFGVYLAVIGLCEVAGQWSFVFPTYVRDPAVGVHFGRARGPMVHSVTYGIYLATALLALWELVRNAPHRGSKLALASLAPLFAAGLYFSYTRSVWLGTGLALIVMAAMTLPIAWRKLALGIALIGAVFVGAFKLDAIVGLQREGSVADTRQSVDMRGSFAYVSWLMFQDRPWFGFGFGQFPTAKLDYLSDRSSSLPLEQIRGYVHHNSYLSLLTETGLVGLGLFLAVLAGWSRRAWRLWNDAQQPPWARSMGPLTLGVLAIYACQLMFHELSYTPLDHALVFCFAGVTAGLTTRTALAHSASSIESRILTPRLLAPKRHSQIT